ncbi:hypothetical protein ACHHYP_03877 [Achlya hypogyna]|uniref:Ankyrin repeat domain-containing protein n=1 Tax=Achlya hypogyna TaxID=1202772 RepID=A0A1V9ZPN1_ACHHY|nr:hypothetical protein ACHHYP_03877 [Achlya hypogyna]
MEFVSALHIAVWNGDVDQVRAALAAGESVETRDRHGHRALHLALQCAHRNTKAIVDILIDEGHARVRSRDGAGWKAVQLALLTKNEELIAALLARESAEVPSALRKKILAASQQLASMPDFVADIDVKVTSWVPMLSSLLPADTLHLFKSGGRLRVDMSLTGFKSLRWKRGRRSILLLADRLVTLDHDKHIVRDWLVPAVAADQQLHLLLTNRASAFAVDASHAQVQPRHHWLSGAPMTEPVGPWGSARVYDVEELRVRIDVRPAAKPLPAGAQEEAADILAQLCAAETSVVISPGLEHAIPISMRVGESIGWRFYVANDLDIEFSVCFVKDEWYNSSKAETDPEQVGLIVEVVREQRVRPTKACPVTGTYTASSSGNLIVRWDNAHAMFRSKTLHFTVFPVLHGSETADVRPPVDTCSRLVTFEDWFGVERTTLPPALANLQPKPAVPMHIAPPTAQHTKSIPGTVYMADTFPLTMAQFLPVVQVLATTSSQFASMASLLESKLPPGFPVQLTAPIFPSISVTMRFEGFSLQASPPELFVVPETYTVRKCGATAS